MLNLPLTSNVLFIHHFAGVSLPPYKKCQRIYSFCISEHSDGSGFKANLTRYNGNKELLEVIIKTLRGQLEKFNQQLKDL